MPTIADLIPDPKNARKRGPRAEGVLVSSLHEVGAARSIVIDENNRILAGNGTVQAAAEAGIERVQVVDADGETIIAVRRTGLTDAQKKRLAILDNRTGELAEWDTAVLAELAQEGIPLDDLWSTDELEALLAGVKAGPAQLLTDPDAIPDEVETRCKPGDLWKLGEHRLLCGDSTKAEDVARLMGGQKAGAVVTDPPYGINHEGITNDAEADLAPLFASVIGNLPATDAIVIAFQSPRLFPYWLDAIRAGGQKFERMLWMYKPNDATTFPWRGWLMTSEAILVSSIGKAEWQTPPPEYLHDCITVQLGGLKDVGGLHTTPKPMAAVLNLVSNTTGNVYDPFLGSGTTLIACEQLGRKCYGMEIDPHYCDVIIQRYEDSTGKQSTLIEGGQS